MNLLNSEIINKCLKIRLDVESKNYDDYIRDYERISLLRGIPFYELKDALMKND